MPKTSFIIFFILSLLGLLTLADYQLVWQDEFNGNKLDTSKWQYENHCQPQNNEMQCYTPRESNVYVKDGYLNVEAKPETGYLNSNKKYTSGRINTKHSAAWKYGKFEIRAKLPKGAYLWPALWMLPRDYVYGGWAASGEIDIMEARGQQTNQVSNAIHYGAEWPNNAHSGSGAMDFSKDFTADFHLFSAIWEKDQIQFLVDNKVVSTQSLTRNFWSGKGKNPYNSIRQPFDQPFFFLINVAIGGNFFGSQSADLTTDIAKGWASPRLVVDYVRVYQDNGSPVVNPVPVPVTAAPVKSSEVKTSAKTSAKTSEVKTSAKTSEVKTSAKTSTPAASTSTNICSGKCNGQSCCADQKNGAVCFNANAYICADDFNGKKTLCGKGLGACNSVCYNTTNYKCVSGVIKQK